jgi:hypothetical protein
MMDAEGASEMSVNIHQTAWSHIPITATFFHLVTKVGTHVKFFSKELPTCGLHTVTNSVAPEPEGSSPYLQEPATGTYREPAGSNLNSPSQCGRSVSK